MDMDVHMHALGDGAVRWALDMVEQVREQVPNSQSRFTMCHLQIVNPTDVLRFAKLDVVAQSTPTWYMYDDIALEFAGRERFEQMYPMGSDERVTLEQAIRAYTLDAAWQLRLEDQVGSLEVGKQADLVVLSDNLFEMEPHSIHTAKVLLTMMNGGITYDEFTEVE